LNGTTKIFFVNSLRLWQKYYITLFFSLPWRMKNPTLLQAKFFFQKKKIKQLNFSSREQSAVLSFICIEYMNYLLLNYVINPPQVLYIINLYTTCQFNPTGVRVVCCMINVDFILIFHRQYHHISVPKDLVLAFHIFFEF